MAMAASGVEAVAVAGTVNGEGEVGKAKLRARTGPEVPATTLVQRSCSNSQPIMSNVITKMGLSGCQSNKDLENFISVEMLILLILVRPIQAC